MLSVYHNNNFLHAEGILSSIDALMIIKELELLVSNAKSPEDRAEYEKLISYYMKPALEKVSQYKDISTWPLSEIDSIEGRSNIKLYSQAANMRNYDKTMAMVLAVYTMIHFMVRDVVTRDSLFYYGEFRKDTVANSSINSTPVQVVFFIDYTVYMKYLKASLFLSRKNGTELNLDLFRFMDWGENLPMSSRDYAFTGIAVPGPFPMYKAPFRPSCNPTSISIRSICFAVSLPPIYLSKLMYQSVGKGEKQELYSMHFYYTQVKRDYDLLKERIAFYDNNKKEVEKDFINYLRFGNKEDVPTNKYFIDCGDVITCTHYHGSDDYLEYADDDDIENERDVDSHELTNTRRRFFSINNPS